MSADRSSDGAGVYAQTNDPAGNQIIAYRRAADGTLTQLGAYDTGGLGTGKRPPPPPRQWPTTRRPESATSRPMPPTRWLANRLGIPGKSGPPP